MTTAYMQETAAEAGFDTIALPIEEIGFDTELERFVDLAEAPIGSIFKLYPWEWALDDDFGKRVVDSIPETAWVEPLWKTLLSNKALLAVLWEMYPGIRICCRPISTTRTSSPSTSANRSWAARAPI